jgi:hypothetical protein
MQLRQMQVARDVVQDRLTLRVSTQADEEFRVWITRNYLREIWPLLTGMLARHLAATPIEPGTQAAQPSFEQPFKDENPRYPLGIQPLLATEATLTASDEKTVQLTFREGRERTFNLSLNADLLQTLCAMLRAAAEQAAWNLALDYDNQPANSKATPEMPAGNKPNLLH